MHGVKFWRAGNKMKCMQCDFSCSELDKWLREQQLEFSGVTRAGERVKMLLTGNVQDTSCTLMTTEDRHLYDRFFITDITQAEAERMIVTYKNEYGALIDYVIMRDWHRTYDFDW